MFLFVLFVFIVTDGLLSKMRLCLLKNHNKHTDETKAIANRLITLDSAHAGYYRYILSQS